MGTKKLSKILAQFILLFLLGGMWGGLAQAQDPRPPINPTDRGGGIGETGEENGGGEERSSLQCASVSGEVINWGNRPETKLPIILRTGSWEVSAISSSAGLYDFSGLGVGIAWLQIPRAPGETFLPFIQNAAVYLNCDYPTIANIALSGDRQATPPATIQISAPDEVITPDNPVRVTLTVKNTLPTQISNVIVTNAIPPGLIALNASTSLKSDQAKVKFVEGGDDSDIIAAYLDTLDSGTRAEVFITLAAIEDTPQTHARNTATLFYRESAAHQASLEFTMSGRSDGVHVTTAEIIAAASNGSGSEKMSEAGMMEEIRQGSSQGEQPSSTTAPSKPKATPQAATSDADSTQTTTDSETTDPTTEDATTTSEDEKLLPTTGEEGVLAGTGLMTNQANGVNTSTGSLIGLGLVMLVFLIFGFRSVYRPNTQRS
jgi:uncharacterized repeat protein (TIGR01451 family)